MILEIDSTLIYVSMLCCTIITTVFGFFSYKLVSSWLGFKLKQCLINQLNHVYHSNRCDILNAAWGVSSIINKSIDCACNAIHNNSINTVASTILDKTVGPILSCLSEDANDCCTYVHDYDTPDYNIDDCDQYTEPTNEYRSFECAECAECAECMEGEKIASTILSSVAPIVTEILSPSPSYPASTTIDILSRLITLYTNDPIKNTTSDMLARGLSEYIPIIKKMSPEDDTLTKSLSEYMPLLKKMSSSNNYMNSIIDLLSTKNNTSALTPTSTSKPYVDGISPESDGIRVRGFDLELPKKVPIDKIFSTESFAKDIINQKNKLKSSNPFSIEEAE